MGHSSKVYKVVTPLVNQLRVHMNRQVEHECVTPTEYNTPLSHGQA